MSALRRIFGCLLIYGISATGLSAAAITADTTLFAPAGVSNSFLAIPVGARSTGMGDAFTAVADDVFALQWNPAGLGDMNEFQLGLMHNELFAEMGIRQEFLAYAHPLKNAGWGASINYLGLGTIEKRSIVGALEGEEQATAFAGNIGYGKGFMTDQSLKLGLAIEGGMESYYGQSLSAFAASVGALYEINQNLRLGFAGQHLGAGASGFMPPAVLSLGLAYRSDQRHLIVSAEGALPLNDKPFLRAGVEGIIAKMIALRAGYRVHLGAQDGDVLSGFSAGAGFKISYVNIDYAFVPYGDLTATHRVAATIALPGDFFTPKVVLQSQQNTTYARVKYDTGRKYLKKGERVAALIEFKQAVDSYPEKMRNKPLKFYTAARSMIKKIEKELESKGGNEKVQKMIAKELAIGEAHLNKGQYQQAIQRFSRVLELDDNYQKAIVLIKTSEKRLYEKKSNSLKQARNFLEKGDLDKGVMMYRRVLQIDPTDREARQALASQKAAIKMRVKDLHRLGIDKYVNDDLVGALKIWRKALQLEPDDPINMKRDINKAEKLLELRGKK